MAYTVRVKRSVLRELQRVSEPTRSRLERAIDGLAERPFAGSLLRGDRRGYRSLRVGEYRIIYELRASALVALVVRVGHRRDVYRRR